MYLTVEDLVFELNHMPLDAIVKMNIDTYGGTFSPCGTWTISNVDYDKENNLVLLKGG